MPTSSALRTRVGVAPPKAVALRIAETLLPIAVVILAAGSEVGGMPSGVGDVLFIALVVFCAALAATSVPLPIWQIVLACFAVATVGLTGRPNLFAIAAIPLIAFVLSAVDPDVVVRRFLKLSFAVFAVVAGLYLVAGVGAQFDIDAWRNYSQSQVFRSAFGFIHPNRAMVAWSVIAVGVFAFASRRARFWLLVPVLATTHFLYQRTDSRTATFLIVGFAVVSVLGSRVMDRQVPVFFRGLAIMSPAVLLLASFALPLLASVPDVNALLTGRPAIYSGLIDRFSLLAPFGTAAVETEIVDNGYIQLVLAKGVLLAAVYIVVLTRLVATPAHLSWRSVWLLTLFLVLALFETMLMSFAFLLLVLASLELDRRGETPLLEGQESVQEWP